MNVLNAQLQKNYTVIETSPEKRNKKVMISSAIGSAAGITSVVTGIYLLKKNKNPNFKFKELNYDEFDILKLGAGSVIGGLIGGLISDTDVKNRTPKMREASMQFFGSLMCPVAILTVANNLLEKSKFKLPNLKSNTSFAQKANILIDALPKICTTIGSLVLGMNIGNKIMNKVNNAIFDVPQKREVHKSDYLVHTDDLCIMANFLLKDSKSISQITSKILPASFILAGTKSGYQQAE